MQRESTREKNVLDLFFTNKPGLVKSVHAIPGLSDHDIVMADCSIKAQINKQPPRYIHMWSKADWDKIKKEASNFCQLFLQNAPNNSVDANYKTFKNFMEKVIKDNVPSKLLRSAKKNLPWITQGIRRMCRKKQRLFNKAKNSHKDKDWKTYKSLKKDTLKAIRRAHWQYVNNILMDSLENKDPKPFWRYIKAKKQDVLGVSPLKVGCNLFSDAKAKATILNDQFKSVFTEPQEPGPNVPHLEGPKFPSIEPIEISVQGVQKLMSRLNVKKASGPDNVTCRFLRELSIELAPVLRAIFIQSLDTGEIPEDWSQALVTPIFKKGNRHLASNYRPVSLTSVPCKLLEHIICSHIRGHLDRYNILSPLQHGFRGGHSCESQLLLTLQDLMCWRDRKVQVDLAVLDFAKAFDTVPHESLLGKLNHYGVNNNIHSWIRAFLTHRSQEVVVDGCKSERVSVDSGVPQGTVMGPLLFLLHINDLPQNVQSTVRLFADDCLLYRPIRSMEDAVIFQNDLTALEKMG